MTLDGALRIDKVYCFQRENSIAFIFYALAGKYRIQPEDIFLVHDDLDKPMGKFSIKRGGSAR